MINKYQTTKTSQRGFTLVEFMISMALSLAAVLVVTSIYVTSFSIDSKTIKFSRLNDEVTSIMALLSEDIKRAGFVEDAEEIIKATVPAGNTSRCNLDATKCADIEFRTILVDKFTGEDDDSCILFSYDFFGGGTYSVLEAFGYRIHNGKLETRQAARSCTEGYWQALTDPSFVTISALNFKCKVSDDGDNTDYETDTVTLGGVTTVTNIELSCAAGNLPYAGAFNGTITVEISFTATLVDDAAFSLTTSEKVLVRNVSYD